MLRVSGSARVVVLVAIGACVITGCQGKHHSARSSPPLSTTAQRSVTPANPSTTPTAVPVKYDNFSCNHDAHNSSITVYNVDGSTRWTSALVAASDGSRLLTNGSEVFVGSNGAVAAYRTIDGA